MNATRTCCARDPSDKRTPNVPGDHQTFKIKGPTAGVNAGKPIVLASPSPPSHQAPMSKRPLLRMGRQLIRPPAKPVQLTSPARPLGSRRPWRNPPSRGPTPPRRQASTSLRHRPVRRPRPGQPRLRGPPRGCPSVTRPVPQPASSPTRLRTPPPRRPRCPRPPGPQPSGPPSRLRPDRRLWPAAPRPRYHPLARRVPVSPAAHRPGRAAPARSGPSWSLPRWLW
jgi:hypothetical protein